MTRPSRPLIGLLVATVVFFALWLVALKPSSSSTSGSSGLGQYQSAINAAKASAAAQNRAAAAAGNTVAGSGSRTSAAAAGAKPAKPAKPAGAKPSAAAKPAKPAATAKPATATRTHPATRTHARVHTHTAAATPTQRVNLVDRALAGHRVLALLFYNPAAPDDQAVKRELGVIPARHGRVVKLAIPLSEVASYPVVTNQVLIQTSPTLVIIDRSAQAFTLVGFVDGLEIAQRVDDALTMR